MCSFVRILEACGLSTTSLTAVRSCSVRSLYTSRSPDDSWASCLSRAADVTSIAAVVSVSLQGDRSKQAPRDGYIASSNSGRIRRQVGPSENLRGGKGEKESALLGVSRVRMSWPGDAGLHARCGGTSGFHAVGVSYRGNGRVLLLNASRTGPHSFSCSPQFANTGRLDSGELLECCAQTYT